MTWVMISEFAKISAKVKGYVRDNWGSPFIIIFMLLLVVAAVSLSMDVAGLANEVAVYAYYTLFIGIGLQLVCFIKWTRKSGKKS
jgi:hypothetical protein